jgi:amino acid transporter
MSEVAEKQGASGPSQPKDRPLRFPDVLIYCLGSGISVRWIAVAAAAGPSSVTLWAAALLLFYVPQVVAVAVLTSQFRGEGGIYLWTRATLGEFAGFMCGWIYWMANLPYLPGLLYFLAGVLAFMGGGRADALGTRELLLLSVGIMLVTTAMNVVGLRIGKWLTNVGGIAVWLILMLIFSTGAWIYLTGGAATRFTAAAFVPGLTAPSILLWATVVFALGGAEGIGFLRTEVAGGPRAIVKALLAAGAAIMAGYLLGTVAVMAVLPPAEVTNLGGVAEALTRSLQRVGWEGLRVPALAILALSAWGGLNAWYQASARLPFAAGIDAYLPAVFGRRHPKWDTPFAALLLQTSLVIVFLLLSQAGGTVRQTYDFFIRMGVIGYSLPYLFLFMAFLKAFRQRRAEEGGSFPLSGTSARLIGLAGLAATLSAIGATLVPDPQEPDPLRGFLRIALATVALFLSGLLVYASVHWWRDKPETYR